MRVKLLPVAEYGALVYSILQQLGRESSLQQTNWGWFTKVFTSAVVQHTDLVERIVGSSPSNQDEDAIRVLVEYVRCAVLQATVR